MTPTLARLYAMLHRGTPGDRAFYREVCRGATTVLELGVEPDLVEVVDNAIVLGAGWVTIALPATDGAAP